jgi:hypothetical protein
MAGAIALLLALAATPASAQDRALAEDSLNHAAVVAEGPAPLSANTIGRSLANPLARLTTISTELRLAAGMGDGRHGLVNETVLVKPFELPDSWAIITRAALPVALVENSRSYVGLTDATLAAYLVTPPRGPWYAGVGPTMSLPTANRPGLGSRNWELGPAAAFGYQSESITSGILVSQRWTLGGASAGPRTTLSVLQGLFSFSVTEDWSAGISTETHYDWEGHGRQRWTVPITLSLGRVFTLGNDRAVQVGGLATHYIMPGGPQRAVWEFGLNLAFVVPNGFLYRLSGMR